MTITGPVDLFKASGGAQVVIKVQDTVDVTSSGLIDLSGGDGIAGGDQANHDGGKGGAGGSEGGKSVVGGNGLNGIGVGSSFGVEGLFISGSSSTNGGGGGGGSFRTKNLTEPKDGYDTYGIKISKGKNGNISLTDGSQFEESFIGGSSGAAGGGGAYLGTLYSGGSGGGSGGAEPRA